LFASGRQFIFTPSVRQFIFAPSVPAAISRRRSLELEQEASSFGNTCHSDFVFACENSFVAEPKGAACSTNLDYERNLNIWSSQKIERQ